MVPVAKCKLLTYSVGMNITSREEFLPLTPQTYHILLALAENYMTGYDVIKKAQADAGRYFKANSGMVYPALGKLLRVGLIYELENDGALNRGKPRRIYALTDLGRQVLTWETERMEVAASRARERLLGKPADLAD